jgi:hypothetical protein
MVFTENKEKAQTLDTKGFEPFLDDTSTILTIIKD